MINDLRIRIAEFLHTVIYGNSYFFFDFWSLIHFSSGFFGMLLIFKFLRKISIKHKFILLFGFVIFWEFFELISTGQSIYFLYSLFDSGGSISIWILRTVSSWIVLESKIDIIYDLFVGMFGGLVYYSLRNKLRLSNNYANVLLRIKTIRIHFIRNFNNFKTNFFK